MWHCSFGPRLVSSAILGFTLGYIRNSNLNWGGLMGRVNNCFKQNRPYICLISLILFMVCFRVPIVRASDVIGDINGNGVVNLEESIYALQVVAGMSPGTILDSGSGPRRAAWGTYTFSSNTLTLDITFSSFDNAGPPIGTWEFSILEVTPTSITVSGRTWIRTPGAAGDIVGKWVYTDLDNNVESLILDSNGAMLWTAKGPMFTEVVEVQTTSSITIDGNFTDWSGFTEYDLYNIQNKGCTEGEGNIITGVSAAQDDDFIYVRMTLDGTYQNSNYGVGDDLIKIYANPPNNCGFVSPVGGESTGVAAFSGNSIECRVSKCLVEGAWNKAGFDVRSGCGATSNLSLLKFDFSTCP